jgi:hypothetical protein
VDDGRAWPAVCKCYVPKAFGNKKKEHRYTRSNNRDGGSPRLQTYTSFSQPVSRCPFLRARMCVQPTRGLERRLVRLDRSTTGFDTPAETPSHRRPISRPLKIKRSGENVTCAHLRVTREKKNNKKDSCAHVQCEFNIFDTSSIACGAVVDQ